MGAQESADHQEDGQHQDESGQDDWGYTDAFSAARRGSDGMSMLSGNMNNSRTYGRNQTSTHSLTYSDDEHNGKDGSNTARSSHGDLRNRDSNRSSRHNVLALSPDDNVFGMSMGSLDMPAESSPSSAEQQGRGRKDRSASRRSVRSPGTSQMSERDRDPHMELTFDEDEERRNRHRIIVRSPDNDRESDYGEREVDHNALGPATSSSSGRAGVGLSSPTRLRPAGAAARGVPRDQREATGKRSAVLSPNTATPNSLTDRVRAMLLGTHSPDLPSRYDLDDGVEQQRHSQAQQRSANEYASYEAKSASAADVPTQILSVASAAPDPFPKGDEPRDATMSTNQSGRLFLNVDSTARPTASPDSTHGRQFRDRDVPPASRAHDKAPQSQLVQAIIQWPHGGNEVHVAGTFNGWREKVQLQVLADGAQRQHPMFYAVVPCTPGVHQVRFLVDSQWRFDPTLPTATDPHGGVNNVVRVAEPAPAVQEPRKSSRMLENMSGAEDPYMLALGGDQFDSDASDPWESSDDETAGDVPRVTDKKPKGALYSQQVPSEDEFTQDMPLAIPPHFSDILLNSQIRNADPYALPPPVWNVTVNHVYLFIKPKTKNETNDTLIMGTTQRHRSKFVTTVYYKPRSTAMFNQKDPRSGGTPAHMLSPNESPFASHEATPAGSQATSPKHNMYDRGSGHFGTESYNRSSYTRPSPLPKPHDPFGRSSRSRGSAGIGVSPGISPAFPMSSHSHSQRNTHGMSIPAGRLPGRALFDSQELSDSDSQPSSHYSVQSMDPE